MAPQPLDPQSRRHAPRRSTVLLTAGAVALLLTACGGEVAASGDVHMGEAEGDAIEIAAVDNAFEPSSLDLEPGEEVSVEITNNGKAPHNFVIEELDLSTGTIQPGEAATATFTVPEGSVEYRCTLHPSMRGELG